MKRIRSFALLAVPASLYAAGVHAQSSVTLYGIADAGVAYVHDVQNANGSNASNLVRFSSGKLTALQILQATTRFPTSALITSL